MASFLAAFAAVHMKRRLRFKKKKRVLLLFAYRVLYPHSAALVQSTYMERIMSL